MITFFTIIIVMNLIAWIYAKKELKKVEEKLSDNQEVLHTLYKDRYDFIKRTKEAYKKTDSLREESGKQNEA